jgi:hypothetical protein
MALALRWVFCTDIRTDSDFCFIHHWLTGFYNRGGKCLLHGTNWVFKRLNPPNWESVEWIHLPLGKQQLIGFCEHGNEIYVLHKGRGKFLGLQNGLTASQAKTVLWRYQKRSMTMQTPFHLSRPLKAIGETC